jgi:hypothetical protein
MARSDGQKCYPLVLIPNKTTITNIIKKFENKLHLRWVGQESFDEEIIAYYLQNVIGRQRPQKSLIVWDGYKHHISQATQSTLKRLNLDSVLIPPECGKFIQVFFFV